MRESKTKIHSYIYEPECDCGKIMKKTEIKARMIKPDLYVYECECGKSIESIFRLERIIFQKEDGEEVLWYNY